MLNFDFNGLQTAFAAWQTSVCNRAVRTGGGGGVGVFSTSGDILSTSGDGQYIVGIS